MLIMSKPTDESLEAAKRIVDSVRLDTQFGIQQAAVIIEDVARNRAKLVRKYLLEVYTARLASEDFNRLLRE